MTELGELSTVIAKVSYFGKAICELAPFEVLINAFKFVVLLFAVDMVSGTYWE